MKTKLVLILLFALAVIILGPIATIWSLNALFPVLAIPISFDTWCAALILGAVVGGKGLSFSSK
jgi:hypothetical protein